MPHWNDLDEQSWQLMSGLHRVLLRLAGVLPDDALSYARDLLGGYELVEMASGLPHAMGVAGTTLTPQDYELLVKAVEASGWDASDLGDVATGDGALPEVRFTFSPYPPHIPQQAADRGMQLPLQLDATRPMSGDYRYLAKNLVAKDGARVAQLLSDYGRVCRFWRAWRLGGGGGHPDMPIYLIEVEPGVRAWELVREVEGELAWLYIEQRSEQIEVFWAGEPLPAYHQLALANSLLIWASGT